MILNVSGRTDIVAFYSDWFINRLKEGFVDVGNPFNNKMVKENFKNHNPNSSLLVGELSSDDIIKIRK